MLTRARKALYRLRGHCTTTLAGERFRCDPYHSKFWRKAGSGAWEPETFEILDRYLTRESDYLDIGAWIGPTVLYGARRARHVWAFEPDATAFRALSWNIDLNDLGNVSALPAALSDTVGIARMASFRDEPGDSTTSLLNPDGATGRDVLTLGWEDFANNADLERVSLVKIDIEGAEYDVLPHLRPWLERQRPALLLSTHAPYLDDAHRNLRSAALADMLSIYPDWRDTKGRGSSDQPLAAKIASGFQTVLLTG